VLAAGSVAVVVGPSPATWASEPAGADAVDPAGADAVDPAGADAVDPAGADAVDPAGADAVGAGRLPRRGSR
jgi:hypothetical protein